VRRLQLIAGPQNDWSLIDSPLIEAEAGEVVGELGALLQQETEYERVDFLLLRARAMLAQHALQLGAILHDEGRIPLATELAFGDQPGSALPALSLGFEGGRLQLSGKIDRVDSDAAGQATVVDYKLGQRSFKDSMLLAGAQIQMYVYLLALAQREAASSPAVSAAGQQILDLEPRTASYQSIEASWNTNSELELRSSSRELSASDAGEWEAPARANSAPKLRPSLELVRRLLTGLAGDIASGEIDVSPLRDGPQWSACGSCDYRSVCRFDPLSQGRYRPVERIARRNLERSGLQPGQAERESRPRGRGAKP
jgi:ATP-dependent helicase/DNAse subunit B